MRTLISVASVCTLFVLAASNAACSRTTHTSVADKSQPKAIRPDIDNSRREPITTEPSSKYPTDLPTDPELQREAPPQLPPPPQPQDSTKSLPPNDTTFPKSDDLSKPSDMPKPIDSIKNGQGLQSPESSDPAQREADTKLTSQVRSAIIADSTVASNADALTVTCRSGVVTLQGTVKDQEQKDAIVVAVQRVPGVDRVDDQLTLPRN